MSERQIRELFRRASRGDDDAHVPLLRAMLRGRQITPAQVEILAALGDVPAMKVEQGVDKLKPHELRGLGRRMVKFKPTVSRPEQEQWFTNLQFADGGRWVYELAFATAVDTYERFLRDDRVLLTEQQRQAVEPMWTTGRRVIQAAADGRWKLAQTLVRSISRHAARTMEWGAPGHGSYVTEFQYFPSLIGATWPFLLTISQPWSLAAPTSRRIQELLWAASNTNYMPVVGRPMNKLPWMRRAVAARLRDWWGLPGIETGVPKPPSENPCALCEAEHRTRRYIDDGTCWVADCSSCGVPMVVLKRHTTRPTRAELDHCLRALWSVKPPGSWRQDLERSSIPSHWHAHLRPTRVSLLRPGG